MWSACRSLLARMLIFGRQVVSFSHQSNLTHDRPRNNHHHPSADHSIDPFQFGMMSDGTTTFLAKRQLIGMKASFNLPLICLIHSLPPTRALNSRTDSLR